MNRKRVYFALALVLLLSTSSVSIRADETDNSHSQTAAAFSSTTVESFSAIGGRGQSISMLAREKGWGQEINQTVSNETGEYTVTHLVVENNKIYLDITVKPTYEIPDPSVFGIDTRTVSNFDNFSMHVGFHLEPETGEEEQTATGAYWPSSGFTGSASSSSQLDGNTLYISYEAEVNEEIPDEIRLVFDDIQIMQHMTKNKTINEWIADKDVFFEELSVQAEGKDILLSGCSVNVPNIYLQDGREGEFIFQDNERSYSEPAPGPFIENASSTAAISRPNLLLNYTSFFAYPGEEKNIDFNRMIMTASTSKNVVEEEIRLSLPIILDKEKFLTTVLEKKLDMEVESRDGKIMLETLTFNRLSTEFTVSRKLRQEDFMRGGGQPSVGYGWSMMMAVSTSNEISSFTETGEAGSDLEVASEEMPEAPIEYRHLIRIKVNGQEISMTGGYGEGDSENMTEISMYTYQPVEDVENLQILVLQKDGSYSEIDGMRQ